MQTTFSQGMWGEKNEHKKNDNEIDVKDSLSTWKLGRVK